MRKQDTITISIKKGTERTELNYNKKYFTDYHPRYNEKHGERSRETIYNETPLKNRFYTPQNFSVLEKTIISNTYRGVNNKDKTIDGIYAHLSLNELVNSINKFSALNHYFMFKKKERGEKIKGFGLTISKLILKGGIKPKIHYIKCSPYIFYDIDVKNYDGRKENVELHSKDGKLNDLNKKVFEFMKSISILTARSSSGMGICGIMYCPFLEGITDNKKHKEICISIYKYINENLNPPIQIEFDEAQGQSSQGRRFPVQLSNTINASWNKVEINKNALEFDVKISESEIEGHIDSNNDKNQNNSPKKVFEINTEKYNSEYNKKEYVKIFNRENQCIDLLIDSGFYELVEKENSSGNAVLQKIGKDNKSVNIFTKDNRYNCFTTSLKGSTPFDLYTQFSFKGDSKEAYKSLMKSISNENSGWDGDSFWLDPREPDFIRYNIEDINRIFKNDHDFRGFYLNKQGEVYSEKLELRNMLGVTDRDIVIALHQHYKETAYEYPISNILNNNEITEHIKIEKYLTPNIINRSCNSLINYVYAPCGAGKTTTFLGNEISNVDGIAAEKKILFIVPRKLMVEQQSQSAKSNYNMIASTGDKSMDISDNMQYISSIASNTDMLYDKNEKLRSVITTYDQFVKIPNDIIGQYDYVVLDEAHLLASDDYREAISEAFLKFEYFINSESNVKFILLSATPSIEVLTLKEYFKGGFKVINILKKEEKNPLIFIHNVNTKTKSNQIHKQIMKDISQGKKVIVFIENKEKMVPSWNKLEDYCNSLCLDVPSRAIINGDLKETKVYKGIAMNESLDSQITFTTSILNVGVNITKGAEKGMSFIFDYTSAANHSSACGQLQLLFRNRNRDTTVHCFANILDKENPNLFKINKEAKKSENVYHFFNEMKKKGVYRNVSIKRSLKFTDGNFNGRNYYAESYVATSELEEHTKNDQRNLSSFIILAIQQGCYIEYKYDENEVEGTKKTENIINRFTYNLLKELLKLNLRNGIILVNKQELKQGIITPEILIKENITKTENYCNYYECKYHPSFKSLEKKITRYFNSLRREYKDKNELKNVLNYILNDKLAKKNIDKKLVDYINTYKIISKNNFISKITISELEKLKNITKGKIDVIIESTVPNQVISAFNKLILDSQIEESKLKLFTQDFFKKGYEDHIKIQAKKAYNNLFQLKKEDGKNVLLKKTILNFQKDRNIISNEIDINEVISQLSPKGVSVQVKLFDELTTLLSKKHSSNILDSFKLRDFNTQNDYFNDSNNEKTYEDDFIKEHNDKLLSFKSLSENKRTKFVFAIINNITNEAILSKSLTMLHSQLLEKGILDRMMSLEGYDYAKINNFKKNEKTECCINYTVLRKIPLNNLN